MGLYHGPAPVTAATDKTGILEDYVTSLASDGAGRLYVGHRQKGLEVLDPDTGARVDDAKTAYGGFVDALLPTRTGPRLHRHLRGRAEADSMARPSLFH